MLENFWNAMFFITGGSCEQNRNIKYPIFTEQNSARAFNFWRIFNDLQN